MSEVDQILYQYNRLIAQYNEITKKVEKKDGKRWRIAFLWLKCMPENCVKLS